jgi:hypothetical protein
MAEPGPLEGVDATEREPAPTGIDRLRADDELYQHVPDNPADWAEYAMAEDNLPTTVAPMQMPFAPPLTPERCVCIADTRRFVIRNRWGEIIVGFDPAVVEQADNGEYRVAFSELARALRGEGRRLLGLRRLRDLPILVGRIRPPWVIVDPLRPECRHLATQMTDFQDNAEHMFVARLCSARRSDGEFLTVRDSQIFACKLRSPRDFESEQRIHRFDAAKIRQGYEREQGGKEFDVDEALEDMNAQQESGGGIFRRVG